MKIHTYYLGIIVLYAFSLTLLSSVVHSQTFTVEAESYVSSQGIRVETNRDSDGGQNVGFIQQEDRLVYQLTVDSDGQYVVDLRVASASSGGTIILTGESGHSTSIDVSNTGGWQSWTTIRTSLNLVQGLNDITVTFEGQGYITNLNWLQFTAANFDLKIEAEDFDTSNGVKVESTSDVGGGENVGYINEGDTLSYDVNVPSDDAYTLALRLASPKANNGSIIATTNNQSFSMDVPNTGGWQKWETHNLEIPLAEGDNSISFAFTGSHSIVNLNWLNIANTSSAEIPIAWAAHDLTSVDVFSIPSTAKIFSNQHPNYASIPDVVETAISNTTITLNVKVYLVDSAIWTNENQLQPYFDLINEYYNQARIYLDFEYGSGEPPEWDEDINQLHLLFAEAMQNPAGNIPDGFGNLPAGKAVLNDQLMDRVVNHVEPLFNPGKPIGHEIAHVIGLPHVDSLNFLMAQGTTSNNQLDISKQEAVVMRIMALYRFGAVVK